MEKELDYLGGALEKEGQALVGQDAGGPAGIPATGVKITDDLDATTHHAIDTWYATPIARVADAFS